MPIYEYKCPQCNVEIEVLQSVNEPAPTCEEDGSEMEKLISLTKVRRGGGLYSLDGPTVEDFGEFE